MSKVYKSSVLEGNWQEDCAPPLKFGIYGDFGWRETATSSKTDFSHPDRREKRVQRPERFGMVCEETITEARYAYGSGLGAGATGSGFGALIKAKDPIDEMRLFETTSGDYGAKKKASAGGKDGGKFGLTMTGPGAMGSSGRAGEAASAAEPGAPGATIRGSHFDQMAKRSARMEVAGGPGSRRPERGMLTSGMIGERPVLSGAVNGSRTDVQRAWMPQKDPGLAAYERRARGEVDVPPDTSYMSVQVKGGGPQAGVVKASGGGRRAGSETAAWQAPPRTVTISATQSDINRRRGVRVFSD